MKKTKFDQKELNRQKNRRNLKIKKKQLQRRKKMKIKLDNYVHKFEYLRLKSIRSKKNKIKKVLDQEEKIQKQANNSDFRQVLSKKPNILIFNYILNKFIWVSEYRMNKEKFENWIKLEELIETKHEQQKYFMKTQTNSLNNFNQFNHSDFGKLLRHKLKRQQIYCLKLFKFYSTFQRVQRTKNLLSNFLRRKPENKVIAESKNTNGPRRGFIEIKFLNSDNKADFNGLKKAFESGLKILSEQFLKYNLNFYEISNEMNNLNEYKHFQNMHNYFTSNENYFAGLSLGNAISEKHDFKLKGLQFSIKDEKFYGLLHLSDFFFLLISFFKKNTYSHLSISISMLLL